MKTPITGPKFIQALQDAGILDPHDRIRRVVIDARQNHVVVMHVELVGDQGLLTVMPSLEGVKIQREYRPPPSEPVPWSKAANLVTSLDARERLRGDGRCATYVKPHGPNPPFL